MREVKWLHPNWVYFSQEDQFVAESLKSLNTWKWMGMEDDCYLETNISPEKGPL